MITQADYDVLLTNYETLSDHEQQVWRERCFDDVDYILRGSLSLSLALTLPLPFIYWNQLFRYPELLSVTIEWVTGHHNPEIFELFMNYFNGCNIKEAKMLKDEDWNSLIASVSSYPSDIPTIHNILCQLKHAYRFHPLFIQHHIKEHSFTHNFFKDIMLSGTVVNDEVRKLCHDYIEVYIKNDNNITNSDKMNAEILYLRFIHDGPEDFHIADNVWIEKMIKIGLYLEQHEVKKEKLYVMSQGLFDAHVLSRTHLKEQLDKELHSTAVAYHNLRSLYPQLNVLDFCDMYRNSQEASEIDLVVD